MNKDKLKNILDGIIVASLFLVIIFSLFLINEYLEAKDYCDSISGKIKVKPLNGMYLCNEEVLVNTIDYGWLLESEMPNFNVEKD